MKILTACITVAMTGCVAPSSDKLTNTHHTEAIKQCINMYEMKSDKKLPKEIDRVSILQHMHVMDLLFVKGEMGTFGKRDIDYSAYFVCRTIGIEALGVTFLQAGYEVLFNEGDQRGQALEALDTYVERTGSEDVMEYSYLKQQDGFALFEQQIFSVDNIRW